MFFTTHSVNAAICSVPESLLVNKHLGYMIDGTFE